MSRVALLSLVILAAACGQKGPLYFAPPPEAPPEAEAEAEAEADEAERDRPEDTVSPDGVAPGEPSELP